MTNKRNPYQLSSRTRRLVIVGVVALLVAVGVYIGFRYNDDAPISQGSCVRVEGKTVVNQDVIDVDCSLPDSALKVAVASETECPEGDYTSVLQQSRYGEQSINIWMCFILNGDVGDCFLPLGGAHDIRKVPCSEPKAYRINHKIDGVYEPHKLGEPKPTTSRCADETSISYSEPAVTFCLSKVTT